MKVKKSSRAKRLIKTSLILFIIGLILFNVAFYLVRRPDVQTYLTQKAAGLITSATGAPASVGSVDFHLRKILLRDVFIGDLSNDTLLFVHDLKVRPRLRSIFRRKIDITSLQLESAKLFIHREENDTDFNYEAIFGKSKPQNNSSEPAGYHLRLPVAEISNLDFHFLDERNHNEYRMAFNDLHASNVNLNSEEKYLRLKELQLEGANVIVKKLFTGECDTVAEKKISLPQMLNNAGWDIQADIMTIENSSFSYVNENKLYNKGGMNYNDLHVNNINVDLANTTIVCDTIKSTILNLSASEKCGFVLQSMKAEATVSTNEIECKNLNLVTDNSVIKDYLRFSYESFADFQDFVNKVQMYSEFKNSRVAMKDIDFFAQNALKKMAHNTVWLTGTVRGTVSNLKGKELNLSLSKTTRFTGDFGFKGLPVFKETFITLNIQKLQTTTDEMRVIYPHIKYPSNLDKLGKVNFSGSFTGFPNDFVADGNLATEIGEVSSDINLKIDPVTSNARYSGNFSAEHFNVGKFSDLENLLGEITFDAHVKGKGLQLKNVVATVDGNIRSFNFKQHEYVDLKVDGDLRKGFFKGLLAVRDENLDLDFEGTVDMTDSVPIFKFVSDLRKANLKQLNLLNEDVTVASSLKIDFSGLTLDNFNGYAGMFNTQIKKNGQNYLLDTLELKAKPLGEGAKELVLNSDIADASLNGQFAYNQLPNAMLDLVNYYLDPNYKPTVTEAENFILHLNLRNTQNLTTLIDTAFKNINEGYLNFAFNNKGNRLYLNSIINGIEYGKFKSNDLTVQAVSEEGVIKFNTMIDSLFYKDSLLVNLINVKSRVANDSFSFTIKAQPDDCPNRFTINGLLDTDFKSFTVNLTPSSIFLEGDEWSVSENNSTYYDTEKLLIENLSFFNRKSEVEFESFIDSTGGNHLTTHFNKIDLHDILKPVLGLSKIDLGGELNGTATVLNVLKDPKLAASLTVDSFKINRHSIGNIAIASNYKPGDDKVGIRLDLSGAENNLTASGFYNLKKNDDNLDFSLNIQNLHLPHIEPFIQKDVTKIAGDVSGKLSLTGSLQNPLILGSLNARGVAAKVNFLNTTYSFDDEEIIFTENLIDCGDLHLKDEEGNKAYAIGTISYPTLKEFIFDFDIKTDKFLFLNTGQAPGQPFYGRLLAGGLVFIKGPFNNVEFLISAKTKKDTKIFIDALGSKDVSEYTFYRFINDEDPQTIKKKYVSRLKGVTLNCDVEATSDAEVNVIMSKEDGDVISAKGVGNLNVVLNNYGELSISGDYRITDGNYVFSMQNVISKRFGMEKGSSIRWTGNPTNATLDITGLYKLRASPYDLLSDMQDIATPDEIQKSKNRVQVLLYLYITGSLSQPDIQFDIQVPDADPTIRTALESKFKVLKYHPDEFNRQVVGLLVLNRFLPQKQNTEPSDIGSVMNTSVSEFLSNQLSVYLSDWISEFITEVQLDINYRNYQSEVTGTPGTNPQSEFSNRQELQLALTKSFLNDRISIDVGGDFDFGQSSSQGATTGNNKATNIAGDFEIEYSITADGRIKVKAFRKGEYDIFEDRNKNKTGVGISYEKEFNSVKDFFSNIKRKREERKKEEENKVRAVPDEPGD